MTGALPDIRVGQGVDIHLFSDDPGRPLILGGVRLAESGGLAGHSDADVVAHACTDALLAAAGLGDIGQLYPDTDPSLSDADSVALLADAADKVRAAGWLPMNIDCSVIIDRPRLAPHRATMAAILSEAVGAPVTVKGRRSEGLGALGRGEGVMATAVALVGRLGQ